MVRARKVDPLSTVRCLELVGDASPPEPNHLTSNDDQRTKAEHANDNRTPQPKPHYTET